MTLFSTCHNKKDKEIKNPPAKSTGSVEDSNQYQYWYQYILQDLYRYQAEGSNRYQYMFICLFVYLFICSIWTRLKLSEWHLLMRHLQYIARLGLNLGISALIFLHVCVKHPSNPRPTQPHKLTKIDFTFFSNNNLFKLIVVLVQNFFRWHIWTLKFDLT